MANSAVEGSAIQEDAVTVAGGQVNKRTIVALLLLVGLLIAAYLLHITPGRGAAASFSLLTGIALGLLFERGRFCFYCILRDYIQGGNSGPFYAILVALAVGGIGYAIVFGAFLPNTGSGRLPPGAHIGPVSWPLALAGLSFGMGMALSGACLSGHLYRLGQGYARAPFALFGALFGFGIGFYTWNPLYVATIVRAPILWLPTWLGYGGALLLHLFVLGVAALLLLRHLPIQPAQAAQIITVARVGELLFVARWHPAITGALVGLVGVFAYLRIEPLGVTAQLGSLSRTTLAAGNWLPERLHGLDTLAGCATQVIQTITSNGLLISGLVLAALAAALLGNRFQRSPLTLRNSSTAWLGGILMGWGAMTALGCTVGTLLSGISAFALSGWLFAGTLYVGVWLGIKVGLPQEL